MNHYHNKKTTERVGKRIQHLRESHGWEIEDIMAMTGFSYNTISAIEDGRETNTSHLVDIALAIGVHPTEIFNLPFVIKPRFKLPGKRKEKSRLTSRITKLYNETDFFSSPKFVRDVATYLRENYNVKIPSSSISVILLRLAKEKKLRVRKIGRQNRYLKGKN